MEKDEKKLKWMARICPDNGKLYNGVAIPADLIPTELWPNTVVLDELPEDGTNGDDYKLVDGKLVYAPESRGDA